VNRRLKRWAAILSLILLAAIWLWLDQSPVTRSAKGEAIIIRDGDTISIAGLDHRLHGIDAPEYRQSCQRADGSEWLCGKEAREALVGLTRGKTLKCEELARDQYQRVVAKCADDRNRDIAQLMAQQGMAISLDGFVEGPYADDAQAAKAAKRGLWQGRFVEPAIWRKAHEKAQP
jgi:endonuclease YncB( thermonuclease family)